MPRTMLKNSIKCEACGKGAQVGNNKPHSLHRTRRSILPNIQKNNGSYLCTRCLRTKIKKTN